MHRILVLNLGGTSTKTAIYDDDKLLIEKTINHPRDEVRKHNILETQLAYREKLMKEWFISEGIELSSITAIAIRAGNLKSPFSGGTYSITGAARKESDDAYNPKDSFYHGTQVITALAVALMEGRDLPLFLTDPPRTNELSPEAKIAGHPKFERFPIFHALNQKAVARRIAGELGKDYNDMNIIVAHLGAGTSVGAHEKGRVVDVNNSMRGDGPMSPNRVGQLPIGQLVDYCFEEGRTLAEVLKLIREEGGFMAYLGTDDLREVEKMIADGDKKAEIILNAYVLQVAKSIGACYTTLNCKTAVIILTGGISNSKMITGKIAEKVGKIAEIKIIPGELENEGLALGAWRVLTGQEKPVVYP